MALRQAQMAQQAQMEGARLSLQSRQQQIDAGMRGAQLGMDFLNKQQGMAQDSYEREAQRQYGAQKDMFDTAAGFYGQSMRDASAEAHDNRTYDRQMALQQANRDEQNRREQQHQALQMELAQTDLSQSERMDLQSYQNGIAEVNRSDELHPEDKEEALSWLMEKKTALEQRQAKAAQLRAQVQSQQMIDQHAKQVWMENEAQKFRASTADQRKEVIEVDGKPVTFVRDARGNLQQVKVEKDESAKIAAQQQKMEQQQQQAEQKAQQQHELTWYKAYQKAVSEADKMAKTGDYSSAGDIFERDNPDSPWTPRPAQTREEAIAARLRAQGMPATIDEHRANRPQQGPAPLPQQFGGDNGPPVTAPPPDQGPPAYDPSKPETMTPQTKALEQSFDGVASKIATFNDAPRKEYEAKLAQLQKIVRQYGSVEQAPGFEKAEGKRLVAALEEGIKKHRRFTREEVAAMDKQSTIFDGPRSLIRLATGQQTGPWFSK